jgi:hypothetical protein
LWGDPVSARFEWKNLSGAIKLGSGTIRNLEEPMSALYRARARLLVFVAALAAFGALALAPAAGAEGVGRTYLALGDSLAYGYHQAQFQEELETKGFVEPANFNDGYVDDFGAALRLLNPKLQIVNDGCPGETTETMIKGSGVYGPEYCAGGPTGSPFPKAFLHHSYPGTQLEDALAIAKEPRRRHDHARHRRKRHPAVPRTHLRLPGDVHVQSGTDRSRDRARHRERRVHPGSAARGRTESEDHLRLAIQPLSDGVAA